MTLALSDWWAIIAYLAITLALGLYFRGRSGRSTEDYFVSGREVSWWLAGTSMVSGQAQAVVFATGMRTDAVTSRKPSAMRQR